MPHQLRAVFETMLHKRPFTRVVAVMRTVLSDLPTNIGRASSADCEPSEAFFRAGTDPKEQAPVTEFVGHWADAPLPERSPGTGVQAASLMLHRFAPVSGAIEGSRHPRRTT